MDYSQPAACLELLDKLHPTDIDHTHDSLNAIVEGLLEASPPPNQHLEVLERARELIHFTQQEQARHYTSIPLPPHGEGNRRLHRVTRLWQHLARSYARIARADATSGNLEDQSALLAQRRVHYASLVLAEYFRARREIPPGCWSEVHAALRDARQRQLAQIRVADSLNEVWGAQSALEAYVASLLVDLANPYSRTAQELSWTMRWAQRFAPYCSLQALDAQAKGTNYAVELHGDSGLRPLATLKPGDSVLRFDSSQLAIQIEATLAQINRGTSPAALGLGHDCPTNATTQLLLSLYRPWGHSLAGRRFPRRPAQGAIQLSSNWLSIGFALSGRVFQQPGSRLGERNDLEILTFGERVPDADSRARADDLHQRQARQLGLDFEHWDIIDESIGGFRVQRAVLGERLSHHQLIGFRPDDASQFLLGDLNRLMYYADGRLEAGIEVLPGIPVMAAVRPPEASADTPWQQAFIFKPSDVLNSTPLIVMPLGLFRRQRRLGLQVAEEGASITLTRLLRSGANYDYCEYRTDD